MPIDGTAETDDEVVQAQSDDYVGPCEDGPERRAARAAFDDLSTRIGSLGDTDDPKLLTGELTQLLETQCFRLSSMHETLAFDSAISLRTWWETGGADWTEHFLLQAEQRVVMVPPTPRKTATKEIGKKHPLASLVCADDDAACAKDTVGWSRRAARAFELRATRPDRTAEICEKEALAEKGANERFVPFRSCLDDATPRRTALPLGRFKSASDGWLVITANRRCGDLRAYDLASGAAFVVSDRCGRATTPTVKAGRVSVAALREAMWMMLVAPMAESGVRLEVARYDVPKSIPIVQPERVGWAISTHCGGCGVSGARQWSWMRDQSGTWKGRVSGVIHPNMPCDDAEDHAAELLAIADDTFEEGCAPASPPAFSWGEPGPAIKSSPAAFDDPDKAAMRTALSSARSITAVPCAKKP